MTPARCIICVTWSEASEGGESEQELHADMDAYLEAGGYDESASEGGESERELHADMDAYLEAGGYDSDEGGDYSDRYLHEAMDAYLYSGGDDPDPECTLRDAVDSYFQPGRH